MAKALKPVKSAPSSKASTPAPIEPKTSRNRGQVLVTKTIKELLDLGLTEDTAIQVSVKNLTGILTAKTKDKVRSTLIG
jgi:hypothetical protein